MPEQSNREALARFFRSEYRNLVEYAKRRLDALGRLDAEDLVQDVAANLFNRADVAAPIENLTAYAYHALRNRLADYFRKKRQTVSLDDPVPTTDGLRLADVIAERSDRALSEIERMEIACELHQAMEDLRVDEKAIVIATQIEGRSFRELAEAWQIPINTLLSRKARALNKIQQKLNP